MAVTALLCAELLFPFQTNGRMCCHGDGQWPQRVNSNAQKRMGSLCVCVCVNLLAVLYSSRLVKVQTNGTACGSSNTIFAAVLEYPTEAEAFIIGDRQVCLTPGESQVWLSISSIHLIITCVLLMFVFRFSPPFDLNRCGAGLTLYQHLPGNC